MSNSELLEEHHVRRRGRGVKSSQKTGKASSVTPGWGVASKAPKRPAPVAAPAVQPPAKRRKIVASGVSPETVYSGYRGAVEDRRLAFFHIDPSTWVAEICNLETLAPLGGSVSSWAVLRCEVDETECLRYNCTCPDYMAEQDVAQRRCVHTLLLESDDRPPFKLFTEDDEPACVLFEHIPATPLSDASSFFIANVPGHNRRVVHHRGRRSRKGEWLCSTHRAEGCGHVAAARDNTALKLLLDEDGDEEDEDEGEDKETSEKRRLKVTANSLRNLEDERSISRACVGPPVWARISSDSDEDAPTFDLVDPLPDYFELGPEPQCRCGSPPRLTAPVKVIKCYIYDLARATEARIEVQLCSTCKPQSHQFAGPELRELGIFNFNNSRLYTHRLFDKYTSLMTVAEVPFHAFHASVTRDYMQSQVPFVCEGTFRTVYFAFSRVQKFDVGFVCNICGDEPDIVVCDGVSASYDVKLITDFLRPPTAVDEDTPRIDTVRPLTTSAALVNGDVRKRAQQAVRWRMNLKQGKTPLAASADSESSLDEDVDAASASKVAASRRKKRDASDNAVKKSLPGLATELAKQNAALAQLFGVYVVAELATVRKEIRAKYLRLLEQLLAYESVLQFAGKSSWPFLDMLQDGDEAGIKPLLSLVPALAVVAQHEVKTEKRVSKAVRSLAGFVLKSSQQVLASLSQHDPDKYLIDPVEEDWRETGTFYGRPRIRMRPVYPNIPGDGGVDRASVTDSGGKIGCSKFYQAYGKRGLTGGLLIIWCPHSVCYGFHCIPKGEGRNDVFSAVYTHWPRPPRKMIYDYACALAPYCMLCEPIYYGDTQFLIDKFHAQDHTRCSPACFLSGYADWNETLRVANSSAGECGNASLLKIRKSLSYLSQRHAIVLTHIFLAVWNHTRIKKREV